MKARPAISVAMTTCNGAGYLRAQLDSILAQTLPAAEIVVCDDGSQDGTLSILEEYAAKGKLRVYQNERQLGIVQNFKRAASLCAEGNYIALSDQDDVWLPEKLERGFEALNAIDDGVTPSLSYHDVALVSSDLSPLQPSFWQVLNVKPKYERFRSLLFGNIMNGCSLLMNDAMRQQFVAMPDDDRVMMHDAWLGLIAYSFGKHAVVSAPLIRYRQHGNNATFATNQEQSVGDKLRRSAKQMSTNQDYLKRELEQAVLFHQEFREKLSKPDLATLESFIRLQHASFWRKKYSSILARSYRWSKK